MKHLTILLLLAVTLISGCNTVAGFGQDIKKVGDSLNRAGSRHK